MQSATYSTGEKYFRIIAFLFGLIILIMQFVLLQNNAAASGDALTRTIRFFSFMTILTNILVALAYIWPLLAPASKPGNFFAAPNTQSAIFVYIVTVCLAYHFLLAGIWNPQGLQFFVDKSLHYIVPVVYVLFYFLYVRKGTLEYRNIFKWLLFPLLYLVYAMIRGYITGEYPYPFLDLGKHAAGRIFMIIGILVAVYILLSLVTVWWDRRFTKKPVTNV